MIKRCLHIVWCLVFLLANFGPVPTTTAATVPAGFTDTPFTQTNLGNPTALAFTPDGRMLATTQLGLFWVLSSAGTPLGTSDFSAIICDNVERGLLGVAVDPNFASNRFIYLYYTFNKYNNCTIDNNPNDPVNRVSRFELPADSNLDANFRNSEVILIDNIPQIGGHHNSGDMHFGADGLLYISAGDGTVSSNAQTLTNLAGKILRINPTAANSIPPSNPFVGSPGSLRCGNLANGSGTGPCQEIFAYGLRNPFRFAFRPGTNQFFINDVGQDTWEEISEGQSGANYGWPCREGAHLTGSGLAVCSPLPQNMIDPVFEYQHNTQIPGTTSTSNCNAVTGGAFVPNGIWPGYDGVYLFADYVCVGIFALRPDGQGGYTASDFASNLDDIPNPGPTHIIFGPYNSDPQGAMYYTLRNGFPAIRRTVYGQTPSASISATPIYGPTPLLVTFSAAGSADPGDNPLTYDWDFGDGAVLTGATGLTTTHTYNTAPTGVFTATLVARNANFASSPASIRIYPNNAPPLPVINTPITGTLFAVGQDITLNGSATDSPNAASTIKLNWDVLLHHLDEFSPGGEHTHPEFSTAPVTTTTGTLNNTITMPAPEGLRATKYSFIEVRLTATDALGLSATVTRTLQPIRVNVTFATNPSGLSLSVNDALITTTQTVTSWANYNLNVLAPSPQTGPAGYPLFFSQWSDSGAASHIITTPGSAITYTAVYRSFLWLPLIGK